MFVHTAATRKVPSPFPIITFKWLQPGENRTVYRLHNTHGSQPQMTIPFSCGKWNRMECFSSPSLQLPLGGRVYSLYLSRKSKCHSAPLLVKVSSWSALPP